MWKDFLLLAVLIVDPVNPLDLYFVRYDKHVTWLRIL